VFRFEKLDVWQKALDFAQVVYTGTGAFPADERFGLTAQMRRAAVSISSNIAEGSSRSSDVDFARFVEIAYGSLMEVVSQALLAHRLSLLTEPSLKALTERAEEFARMLSGLRNSLKRK
jgi:four helix bundle protein